MTSEKPFWFALAESDTRTLPTRKEKRNIPFLAVATVGVAVLGGSLFLNTHDEPTASADVSVTASHVVALPAQSVQSAPAIAPVAQGKSAKSDGEKNDD